jgi:hypothetical protein
MARGRAYALVAGQIAGCPPILYGKGLRGEAMHIGRYERAPSSASLREAPQAFSNTERPRVGESERGGNPEFRSPEIFEILAYFSDLADFGNLSPRGANCGKSWQTEAIDAEEGASGK